MYRRNILICLFTVTPAMLILPCSGLRLQAEETEQIEALKEAESVEGDFFIKLPGKPKLSKKALADSEDVQHQLTAGDAQGVYLVSWQESPKMAASAEEEQMQALKSCREGMEKQLGCRLLKESEIQFRDKVTALRFQTQLPEKRGQMHGTFFFANSRLYQIMVIGTDEFVSSQQAKDVVDSFQLRDRE